MNCPSLALAARTAFATKKAFHLSQNHPFVDGNNRTALASGLTFLVINGFEVIAKNDDLFEMMMKVAAGKSTKAQISAFLQKNTRKKASRKKT